MCIAYTIDDIKYQCNPLMNISKRLNKLCDKHQNPFLQSVTIMRIPSVHDIFSKIKSEGIIHNLL